MSRGKQPARVGTRAQRDKELPENAQSGRVLSCSRRAVSILSADGEILPGRVASKLRDLTVGDDVLYTTARGEIFVEAQLEPRNTLVRSYFDQARRVAANVDHLFIGAAVEPLFNSAFIDRLLVEASLQQIPCTLLVNKVDLGTRSTERLTQIYKDIGVDLLWTSALRGDGMDTLRDRLADPTLKLVVIAGVSGVGKSTIINALIPGAQQRTNEVSERTGQGRQTTSVALGHLYHRDDGNLIFVDLPGIQRYGVSHLTAELARLGFPEFVALTPQCEYDSCTHTKEDKCAVKDAVDAGTVAATRYESYLGILDEIAAAKKY